MKNLLWLISLSALLVLNTCSPKTDAGTDTGTETVAKQDTTPDSTQLQPGIDNPDHVDAGVVAPGGEVDPTPSNTEGGEPASGGNEHTHGSPDQEKLDSIKDAKTKGKFGK